MLFVLRYDMFFSVFSLSIYGVLNLNCLLKTAYIVDIGAVLSRVQIFAALWTIASPNPRLFCPWDFFRQEYCSELSFPFPGDLPGPRIEPTFLVAPALQVVSFPLSHPVFKTMLQIISTLW